MPQRLSEQELYRLRVAELTGVDPRYATVVEHGGRPPWLLRAAADLDSWRFDGIYGEELEQLGLVTRPAECEAPHSAAVGPPRIDPSDLRGLRMFARIVLQPRTNDRAANRRLAALQREVTKIEKHFGGVSSERFAAAKLAADAFEWGPDSLLYYRWGRLQISDDPADEWHYHDPAELELPLVLQHLLSARDRAGAGKPTTTSLFVIACRRLIRDARPRDAAVIAAMEREHVCLRRGMYTQYFEKRESACRAWAAIWYRHRNIMYSPTVPDRDDDED